jgi:hypothetical protein
MEGEEEKGRRVSMSTEQWEGYSRECPEATQKKGALAGLSPTAISWLVSQIHFTPQLIISVVSVLIP